MNESDIITLDSSTIAIPSNNCNNMNCICGLPNQRYCGKCKREMYCSRNCQKKDWKKHKRNCIHIPTN